MSLRPQIDTIKVYIELSFDYGKAFYVDGYVGQTALRELRRAGWQIRYDRTTGDYRVIGDPMTKKEQRAFQQVNQVPVELRELFTQPIQQAQTALTLPPKTAADQLGLFSSNGNENTGNRTHPARTEENL